ncbi:2-keto-4-pentenoate hydratase [Rhodococcoides fascians]|uniref:2-keto-4-pentenoate hydratase n=1 Tax=Rhodococcoides fascians TaxID=1828 RepID=UPI000566025F|nr:fumarylacetoacetate hydrolase family protein [Rhodococcus fascians]
MNSTPPPRSAAETAATRLRDASVNKSPCAPVRDLIGVGDVRTAYDIQQRNITRRLAEGRTVSGRKIGLTSPAVQKQLGVDQPDFGVLLDDMDCTGKNVDTSSLLQPRIEAEVAFLLARDVVAPITGDTAPDVVDSVFAAFEIVDSRIQNWNITFVDTVADNASSGCYVLGDATPRITAPDLASIVMTMTCNGQQVSAGSGGDCLGSPWNAFAWLANTSLSYGSPLRAGEIILTGALGPMVPAEAGATYTAHFSDLGSVTATFTS